MNTGKNTIVVVAVGGNALIRENQAGTIAEQAANVEHCTAALVDIIGAGYQLVLTHGNGPQVGLVLLRDNATTKARPPLPLYIYNAETQGQIGFQLMRSLSNRLAAKGVHKTVTTLLTQVLVDKADPNFQKPTKPIGPFYSKEAIEALQAEVPFCYIEDSGRGYRKVVSSPRPKAIIEAGVIRGLTSLGLSVICAGGGGIPLVEGPDGSLEGCEAVIDKDFTSALLGREIGAGTLMMLTGVERVAINFNKPDMRLLERISVAEAKQYMAEGHFPPGSMGPKMEAAIQFVEQSGGQAIITTLERAVDALQGRTGTVIVP